jgi:DNA-directed RNA polymerase specialized sigma24 family protein
MKQRTRKTPYSPPQIISAGRILAPAGREPNELQAAMQRAVDTLPPRQREIVIRRWRHRQTDTQIAAALDISPPHVVREVDKAVRYLEKALPQFLKGLRWATSGASRGVPA